jgi:hypothetical protein
MSFAAQGGIVETGSVENPTYFGLAAQSSFAVVQDTAAPIAGKVTWYEE